MRGAGGGSKGASAGASTGGSSSDSLPDLAVGFAPLRGLFTRCLDDQLWKEACAVLTLIQAVVKVRLGVTPMPCP